VISLWDVFICHASEDKETVARPLAEALRKRGFHVWYDEFTLKLGDSLRRNIDRGLRDSRYGIVILSKDFFKKEWPQKELDGLNEREQDGKKVILPIWHDVTAEEVRYYSPMLAGRLAAKTRDGMRHIIDMVVEVFGDDVPPTPEEYIITDKIVRIEANKDAFIVGQEILFSGNSANCGDHVHLIISGPGKFSKGVELAYPEVSSSMKWTFQWKTDPTLLAGYYTATVFDKDKTISDEVMIKAEKGAVSIFAQGSGSYYLGEKIHFSGVCTSGKKVYLTIRGPDASHQERKLDQLEIVSQTGNSDTFLTSDVRQDYTWSYVWDTKKSAMTLDEGYYQICAINAPVTSDDLSLTSGYAYWTVSIMIRPPFISGTPSQSLFAKGDPILITGTAEGVQYHEIIIWIFGKEDTIVDKITVNHDASFIYEIPRNISRKLETGQYFVIFQHPMLDDEFGVFFDDKKQNVLSDHPNKGTFLFSIAGEGRLSGFDAIQQLIPALNNSDIDDTYTRAAFHIESPLLRFNSIQDMKQGESAIITAITNLTVGDEIFIDIFSSSSVSKEGANSKHYSIIKGPVRVVKGDNGINKISFEFKTTHFPSGDYIIKASAMDVDVSASSSFKIS
jgi:hypothetical protein